MILFYISSTSNAKVKALLSLHKHRGRSLHGKFLLAGCRQVSRALDGGRQLETLLLSQSSDVGGETEKFAHGVARTAGVALVRCTGQVLDRVAARPDHDGLVAVCSTWRTSLDEVTVGQVPLVLVAVGIEKPGNLGALFRIADSAGAEPILLCDPATDPFNPNVVRSSQGTSCTVPFVLTSSEQALTWLEARGLQVVAASPDASRPYTTSDLTRPSAVVIGSEHAGMEHQWREFAHELVAIPQNGYADSMNVAMSASVLLFEALRQRSKRKES